MGIFLLVLLSASIYIITFFNNSLDKATEFRDQLITQKYEGSLNNNLGFLTLLTTEVAGEVNLENEKEIARTERIKEYLLGLKKEIEKNLEPLQEEIGTADMEDFKLERAENDAILKLLAVQNRQFLEQADISKLTLKKYFYKNYKNLRTRPYLQSYEKEGVRLKSFVFIPCQLVTKEDNKIIISNRVKRELLFSKIIEPKLIKIIDDLSSEEIYQVYFIPISGSIRILNKGTSGPIKDYKDMFPGISSFSNRPYFPQTMNAPNRFRRSNLYIDSGGYGIIVTYSVFIINEHLDIMGMIGIDRKIGDLKNILNGVKLGTGIAPKDFDVGFHRLPPQDKRLCESCHNGRFGAKFDIKDIESNFTADKKIIARAIGKIFNKTKDDDLEIITRESDDKVDDKVILYTICFGSDEHKNKKTEETEKEIAYFVFNSTKVVQKYRFLTVLYILSLASIIALIVVTFNFMLSKGKAEKSHLEVVSHLNGGLIIVDDKGTIKFHNPKMAELVEEKKPDGKNFLDHYLTIESKNEYEDLLKKSKKSFEFTGRIKRADETVFPAIITSASINYPGVTNAQMLIVIPSEQLERTIAAKFIHSFAHTLKTPITSILLLTDRLRRRKALPKFDHYFSLMRQQVDEFTTMVTNLLGFSKLEVEEIRIRKENINLASMLRSSVKSFKERGIKANIEVAEYIPERLMANVDKGMFRVIINNLLENAFKYTEEGKISVTANDTQDEIAIFITDTGIGVPVDERESIFTKFFRGRAIEVQKKEGIGIGLYLTRKYVELHGGTLKYAPNIHKKTNRKGVTTEREIGSIFKITIPKE